MGRGTWDVGMAETWDVVGRAGDNRRFDARQEEKPLSKSNILSEHGQHYLPSWGKERFVNSLNSYITFIFD
jgi:hypothetical protein